MWAITSLPFKELIWIQASSNTRIIGGRATQHFHIESKRLNASNATVLTNQSTTDNSHGVTNPMRKQIHLD